MVNGVDILSTIMMVGIGFFLGCLAMRVWWLMDEQEKEDKEDANDGRSDKE